MQVRELRVELNRSICTNTKCNMSTTIAMTAVGSIIQIQWCGARCAHISSTEVRSFVLQCSQGDVCVTPCHVGGLTAVSHLARSIEWSGRMPLVTRPLRDTARPECCSRCNTIHSLGIPEVTAPICLVNEA
jgi:hypothetical protein